MPDYGGARRLYTDIGLITSPIYPFPYHSSTVVDSAVKMCGNGDGNPVLMPAWRQMMYSAGGFTNVAPSGC